MPQAEWAGWGFCMGTVLMCPHPPPRGSTAPPLSLPGPVLPEAGSISKTPHCAHWSAPLPFKRTQVHSGIQGLSELDKEELPNYISLLPNRASLLLQLLKTSKITLFLFTFAHNYAAERTTLSHPASSLQISRPNASPDFHSLVCRSSPAELLAPAAWTSLSCTYSPVTGGGFLNKQLFLVFPRFKTLFQLVD